MAATAFDYKEVLSVRETKSFAKMPVSGRPLLLDGAYFTNLLGDEIVPKSFMAPIAPSRGPTRRAITVQAA